MKEHEKEGKLQILRLHGISVSKATWPVAAYRHVASGKMAQQRRLLMIKIVWWGEALAATVRRQRRHIVATRPNLIFAVRVIFVLAAVSVVGWLSMYYDWALLVGLVALCLVTTVLILYLLFNDESTVPYEQSQPVRKPGGAPPTPLLPQFPDTPMPATPLIRVLETIDLSSSEVEHFVNATRKSSAVPAQPPATELPKEAERSVEERAKGKDEDRLHS